MGSAFGDLWAYGAGAQTFGECSAGGQARKHRGIDISWRIRGSSNFASEEEDARHGTSLGQELQ
eukprot:8551805-Prorocentrum_lima.AAC.1